MRSTFIIKAISLFILSLIILSCSSGRDTRTTEDLFKKLSKIRQFGEERDASKVKYLIHEFERSNSDVVRIESATALGKIGDPRAIPPMERALRIEKKQNILTATESALSSIKSKVEQNKKDPKK